MATDGESIQSERHDHLMSLAATVVSAYLSNNNARLDEVTSMIKEVYKTFISLRNSPEEGRRKEPAVPIRKSVTDDYIICLEDGKKLKMLKRHLKSAYNMTPEEYRERWGLPPDYPMVAPKYAQRRSELAKSIGLGTRRGSRKATSSGGSDKANHKHALPSPAE